MKSKKKKKKIQFNLKNELKRKSRNEFANIKTFEKIIDDKGYKRHPKHKLDY
ncbi:MAG: hypothetical protein M0R46_00265 [Candidatus Muirbacterium halophilum]|nr:hypothetical protein [Candidatus Muirbacterium halophilum]MCK9474326.1 hypothetical protein [Candidatus Muirbacterium halophilum]